MSRRDRGAFLAGLLVLFVAADSHAPAFAADTCTLDASAGFLIKGDTAVLQASPSPEAFKVTEPFALTLEICDAPEGTEIVRLNARMPAHGHGMNYVPRLARQEDGHYLAKGMLLHMPGEWEFIVDVRSPTHSERLAATIALRP